MKKILLSLFVAFIATTTFAQTRNIDWAVTSIATPTDLQSTNTGTVVNLDVVLTNLGNDSVFVGDTIYIQFAITNLANQILVIYPGPNQNTFSTILAKKDMAKNDTMHFRNSYTVNLKTNFSTDIKLFFTSLIVNRAKGLKFETSTTNNSTSKQMIWFNPQKWPVSVNNTSNTTLKLFPNPAKENTNITLNVVDVNSNVNLNIVDVLGKTVYSNTYSNNENINLDLTNLTKGIYFVKIVNGTQNSVSKLIVE